MDHKPCLPAAGYTQELWTIASLHKHIKDHACEAGFPRLETVSKTRVQQILKRQEIKPFKIKYYCEKRDPDFEIKMHDVLTVYKQVEMQFDETGDIIVPDDYKLTITVSYDEKPGIQAIANTSDDRRPTDETGEVYRDYEYKRLGTVSLLAGIDLLTGEAIPLVSETHKSSDFVRFLKILDLKYPAQDTIRIILDNHSAHTSKETRAFLATKPEWRFEFVFTPKHGSWLNMIEGFFSKMTRQMLRGIRVKSKQELIDRIYKYFEEINADPVVYHWRYKLDEIQL
jgi:transposase